MYRNDELMRFKPRQLEVEETQIHEFPQQQAMKKKKARLRIVSKARKEVDFLNGFTMGAVVVGLIFFIYLMNM